MLQTYKHREVQLITPLFILQRFKSLRIYQTIYSISLIIITSRNVSISSIIFQVSQSVQTTHQVQVLLLYSLPQGWRHAPATRGVQESPGSRQLSLCKLPELVQLVTEILIHYILRGLFAVGCSLMFEYLMNDNDKDDTYIICLHTCIIMELFFLNYRLGF